MVKLSGRRASPSCITQEADPSLPLAFSKREEPACLAVQPKKTGQACFGTACAG
jgi:hypothetical protein